MKPTIIKKGSIRGCTHHEFVVGFIGTCQLCGQVRDYGPCWDEEGDNVVKEAARRGQAILRERRKAGVYD